MSDRMSHWIASMRAGEYAAAWTLAEQERVERDPARRDDPSVPYHLRWVWDGSDYRGKHCLVRCYHGLGDTIQFARFLPVLRARAASVTVEVQSRLMNMLTGSASRNGHSAIRFLPFDEAHPLPPSECDLEITELGFALRATPDDSAMPYLAVSRGVLPQGTVGLCYGAGDWDASRSIPPELFAPHCAEARCITLMPEPTKLPVMNPAGCPFDIDVTAALVGATDLVVTVDTMVAHLAGAMGKPVWLLLKAEPDWRWPSEGHDTPWYPSMRIYSQPTAGDWPSVLERVRRDLTARCADNAEG
jgi:hypothetical protein